MHFSAREGLDPVTPGVFMIYVGGHLEQAREIDLPTLTGAAGGLEGLGWNDGFSG